MAARITIAVLTLLLLGSAALGWHWYDQSRRLQFEKERLYAAWPADMDLRPAAASLRAYAAAPDPALPQRALDRLDANEMHSFGFYFGDEQFTAPAYAIATARQVIYDNRQLLPLIRGPDTGQNLTIRRDPPRLPPTKLAGSLIPGAKTPESTPKGYGPALGASDFAPPVHPEPGQNVTILLPRPDHRRHRRMPAGNPGENNEEPGRYDPALERSTATGSPGPTGTATRERRTIKPS